MPELTPDAPMRLCSCDARLINRIDSDDGQQEDSPMNAATDQAYLDAKLESFSSKVMGEVRLIVAEQANKQEAFEAKVTAEFQVLRDKMDSFMVTQDKNFEDFTATQDRKFEDFTASVNKKFDDFTAEQNKKFEIFTAAQSKRFDDFTAAQSKKFDDFTAEQSKKFDDFTAAQSKRFDDFTASQRIQFAEANALLHKSAADSFKWLMGVVIAIGAVWIGSVTVIVNRPAPAAAPAPLVIYTQPAPVALAPAAATPAQPPAR